SIGNVRGCGLNQLGDQKFDVVINATAASLQGELPSLPENIFAADGWCYDLMYGADPTPFMQWSKQQGAVVMLDGLGMLVEQAAESFYLWRGVRPETGQLLSSLRDALRN
ncbi:MAG: shikimate dehydrogenase, partial [Gammaproteobacteria bacterium]|nr:shikimate dehydrogenase [Gammaproteobacteria bacterium]